MNYYNIIPLQKITTQDYLTYHAPDNLFYSLGQLVFIPLGNKTIAGIILAKTSKPNFSTKQILGVFDLHPLLSPEQLIFCKKLSSEYLTTQGEILYQLLPTKFRHPTKNQIKNAFLPKQNTPPPQYKKPKKFSLNFLSQNNPDEKLQTIKKLIGSKQTLILTPDLTNYLAKKLKSDKKISLFDTSASTNEWESWTKIYRNQPHTILGSHKSILLPLKNLEQIILCENQHQYLKFQQKPFHNLRDAAIFLAISSSIPLYILDALPSIQTLSAIKKYQQKLPKIKSPKSKIEIISSHSENISFQVDELLKTGKKTAVVFFKKGFANSLLCEDCSEVAKCPNCRTILYLQTKDQLVCKICQKNFPLPSQCPKCKGSRLKILGTGIEKLKKTYHKSNIIYGTPEILDNIQGDFENIIVIGPEVWLTFPDFTATEKLFLFLKKALLRTRNLIIQTQNPDMDLWRKLKEPVSAFLQKELKERQKFSLPPYKRQIQIKISHPDQKKLDELSEKLFTSLRELKKDPSIEIFAPQKLYHFKVKDRFSKQIIIRAKRETFPKIAQVLKKQKNQFVKIIVDPENLLS